MHIYDATPELLLAPPPGHSKGLIPRNYATHPKGCYASIPVSTVRPLTDEEIIAAIKRKDAERSWLDDARMVGNAGKPIPSLNQNGVGYCWTHSVVSAILLARARDGEPYLDLSPFAIGCMIKNFRDEGGWAAQAADFAGTRGVPTSQYWPQRSMSRSNDNPQTWENAKLHLITVKFSDIPHNDVRLAATHIIRNTPVTFDIDKWSHSVCGCRVISWNPVKFRIWNSWDDPWGQLGMGEVSGGYLPNDMVAVDLVRGSAA